MKIIMNISDKEYKNICSKSRGLWHICLPEEMPHSEFWLSISCIDDSWRIILLSLLHLYYLYLICMRVCMCVWAHTYHGIHMDVRRQPEEVGSPFQPCEVPGIKLRLADTVASSLPADLLTPALFTYLVLYHILTLEGQHYNWCSNSYMNKLAG